MRFAKLFFVRWAEKFGASALAASTTLLGFILPLSFVTKFESLSKYNSGLEMVLVYGTSWLLHLPIAIAIGTGAALLAFLIPTNRARLALPGFFYVTGFLIAVWLGGRLWLASAPAGVNGPSSPVILGICASAGLVVGVLWPEVAKRAAVVPFSLTLVGGALGFAAIGYGLIQPPPARGRGLPADRLDILLISMDALSNRHFSAMGYGRRTTEGLDAIAERGVTFTQLIAASNFTTPTANTLITGRYPDRHWAIQLKSRPVKDAVDDSLPAQLYAAGYSVRAVSTNPYAGVIKNGYSRYFDAVAADRMNWVAGCAERLSRWFPASCPATDIGIIDPLVTRVNSWGEALGLWRPGRHFDVRMGLISADALFRRGADNRPIFLWVHLMAPHDPYVAPPGFVGRFDASEQMRSVNDSVPLYHFSFVTQRAQHELFRARYDESIAATDHEVSLFIEKLRRSGRMKRTVLLLSADHGESFATDYGGHGGPRLDQAVINIPLIIAMPGEQAGRRFERPVSQADIAPTLLEIAGRRPSGMDGRSLMPALRGEPFPTRPVFSMDLERSSRADGLSTGTGVVIDGRWKYVHYWGQPNLPGYRDLRDGLYDLQTDPGEKQDVSRVQVQRSSAMRTAVRRKLGLDRDR